MFQECKRIRTDMEARKFSRGTPAEVRRRLAAKGHVHGYMTVYKRLTEGHDKYTLDIAAEVEAEQMARSTRDRLLSESVIWPDTSFTGDILKSWLMYRQELKDITKQEGFPLSVVWPVKPS